MKKEDFFTNWERRRLKRNIRNIHIRGEKIEVEYTDGRRELYISDDGENYYLPTDEALARLLLRILQELHEIRDLGQ